MKGIYRHQLGNKGFTLVELLVVLALLGVALAGIYNLFFFTQRSYSSADAENALLLQGSLAVMRLRDEIRSAQKPNEDTRAVVVPGAGGGLEAGQRLDIYRYNETSGKYEQIIYRLNPADKSQLQRGWAESEEPGTGANPSYGTISNWETVLTGVRYLDEANQVIKIFEDITSHSASDRRQIAVNLLVNAPNARELQISNTYMSRSHSPAAEGGIEVPVIRVTTVTLNRHTLDLERGESQVLVATVQPTNATNKNVTWSSDDDSIAVVDQNGTVTGVNRGTTVIRVTTEDGEKQDTCQVNVSDGC